MKVEEKEDSAAALFEIRDELIQLNTTMDAILKRLRVMGGA